MDFLNDISTKEENFIKEDFPPTLYKYRDWKNEFHKSILTDNKIWFAHPKELNDPHDIRVPYYFDYEEVNHPLFFVNLKKLAVKHNWFPLLSSSSNEFAAACENKFEIIKSDPQRYFSDSYDGLRNGKIYDRVGVFSLTKNPLNQLMWAHYGCNNSGFCVGFDTIEIYKSLDQTIFGNVNYDDKPVLHSFIENTFEDTFLLHFRKAAMWFYEEEVRFITLDIEQASDRAKIVSKEVIKEVFVGMNISDSHLDEITKILKNQYDYSVKLFTVKTDNSSFSLKKTEIKY
jgi:hypothetical protein